MQVYEFRSTRYEEGFVKGVIIVDSHNIKVIYTGLYKNNTVIRFPFDGTIKKGVNVFENDHVTIIIDITNGTYIMLDPSDNGTITRVIKT